MNWVADVAATEEIGCLGMALGCAFVMPSIVGEAINVFGTERQKEKYLKPYLKGKLVAAEALVRADETTCISLHSDGYANDASPTLEMRDIADAVTSLEGYPGVFVNTVVYRSWSDFCTLSAIANYVIDLLIQHRRWLSGCEDHRHKTAIDA